MPRFSNRRQLTPTDGHHRARKTRQPHIQKMKTSWFFRAFLWVPAWPHACRSTSSWQRCQNVNMPGSQQWAGVGNP